MIVLILLAALLAAGVIVALLRLSPPGAPVERRVTIEPTGAVRAPMRAFVWARLPGAERFHFELSAEDGSLIWSTTTTDTLLPPPQGLEFDPNRPYRWRVTTHFTDGISLASDEATFQVLSSPGTGR